MSHPHGPLRSPVLLESARLAIWRHGFVLSSPQRRIQATLIDPPEYFGALPRWRNVVRGGKHEAPVTRTNAVGIAHHDDRPATAVGELPADLVAGPLWVSPDLPAVCTNCDPGGDGSKSCSVSGCNGTPGSCDTACRTG